MKRAWSQIPVKDRKLLVQSTFTGHIPKGVWVAQAIAGGELCVYLRQLKNKGQKYFYRNLKKVLSVVLILFIVLILAIVGYYGFIKSATLTIAFVPEVTEQEAKEIIKPWEENLITLRTDYSTNTYMVAELQTNWLKGFILRNKLEKDSRIVFAFLTLNL